MNKYIISLLFAALSVPASAQLGAQRNNLSVGFNAGVNNNSISFNPTIKQKGYMAYVGGLTARYLSEKYFYSSFYTNNLLPETVKFISSYRKWYSKDMINTYPKFGMLGFDLGYFFLNALSEYGTGFEKHLSQNSFHPIQTGLS